MITLKQKHFISLLVAGAVVIGILLAQIFQNPKQAQGSVDFDSSGYQSTSTSIASLATPSGVVRLKGTADATRTGGILGSVIITGGPKVGTIALYDATTSVASYRAGGLKVSTSSAYLMDIPAGAASSTFVCDCEFKVGLLMVATGTSPTSTITWK